MRKDSQLFLEPPARPGITAANACFLASAAGLMLLNLFSAELAGFIRGIFPNISRMTLLLALNAAYYLLCAVLPISLCARGRGGPEMLRLEPIDAPRAIICVLMAAICVLCAEYLGAFWFMLLEGLGLALPESSLAIANTSELTIAIFTVGVLPGICEELLFRGMLLGAYERGGTYRAVLISSVMFMGLHGSIAGAPTQLLLGAAMALIVVYTGSLYASIMFHTAYNSFLVLLGYLAGGAETGEYTTMFEYLGGWSAVVTMLFQLFVLGIALYFAFRRLYRARAENAVLPVEKLKLDTADILVLISGGVTVALFYALDIAEIIGK